LENRDFELVETAGAWKECLEALNKTPRIAMDLEANSLHAYRERICLIQFSIPDRHFVVDPLAGYELTGLSTLLMNPDIEKVVHSSDYDLMLLYRHHGWRISNLFDTMWAGRMLGYKNMGLAWFLKEFYGVVLSKRHQKADWGRRPIDADMLIYANNDTKYLLQLRDDLAARIEAGGMLEEMREIFANLCREHPAPPVFNPDGFRSVRGANALDPREQAILRALYIFRDGEARRRNMPPFKIMGDDALLTIARCAPHNEAELEAVTGVSPRLLQRYEQPLLAAVRRGTKATPPEPPERPPRHPRDVSERYNAVFEWRKEQALARGVESDVVMMRETMWDLAWRNPRTLEDLAEIETLGPHRRKMYGEALLALFK
jgi:ribonuclease D